MNNSLKILYDEHEVIVKAIENARNARALVGRDNREYEFVISELVRFFRVYSDQYHHHKEEEILFPEMQKKNEILAGGILHEMMDNHESFREMIRDIEENLQKGEYESAANSIDDYTNALLDHIAVENDELFQMAYSLFSDEELENIFYRFEDLDRDLGEVKKKDLCDMVNMPYA